MERRLYKVGLAVNFRKEVNMEKSFGKMVKAAQSFSEESRYRKVLTISSIEKGIIYFLIAFNTNRGHEKFTLKSVVNFLKELCSIFGLQYNSKNGYFSIDESIALSEEEYLKLLTEANIHAGAMLFEEKKEQDCETEQEIADEDSTEDEKTEGTKNSFDEDGDIKIPKRKFPVLISGNPRLSGSDKKESPEHVTLQSSLEQLADLIGRDKAKEEIRKISSFIIRNNERCVKLNIDNPGLYYNTAIIGGKGTGKDTIAKILYNIYYSLGVIGKGKFITVDSKEIWPGNALDRYLGNAQSGVVFIDDAHMMPFNDKRGQKDVFTTLDEWFSTYKDNFVFIVAGESQGMTELMKSERVSKHMNFILDMPDFSEQETLELMKHFAAREKYTVDMKVESKLLKYSEMLKTKSVFENAYTARRVIERAIIKNGALNNSNCLTEEDFQLEALNAETDNKKTDTVEPDPFEELEGMIGLQEVKVKVKEIAAYAETQLIRKKLGLKSEPLCLHMNFAGNPGTGKTTVARCIGKILKKIGVLSTGKFVEAAREDLCGKYVGHTAAKTAEKIKEAEGGVLFIDEAYSLDSESKVDYGNEAVNTLVKKMEDLRDNLVVIFAGYPKEMSRFIKMNPGLKDRIQFKLEFVDYNPEELLEIWKKFFNDSEYRIEADALKEMVIVTNRLYENRDNSFSNGRIMRKCFERIKMHQAVRVIKIGVTEAEEFTKITGEDIKSLYKDKDIAELLQEKEVTLKKCIGFAR